VFPHSTGLFTPVAAALAASALRLGPHGLPALPRNAKSPQPPKCRGARFCERDISRYVAQSRNAALQTTDRAAPVVHTSDCHRPAAPQWTGERFSRPARIVPAASSLSPVAARIAEAKRRPREARLAPDTRLVVRGVVPATTQSDLPLTRGLRPASHRNAGQCPNGGGDARRKAENRARQIWGKLVWHRTAALGFGRRKPTASPPTSREVRWKREAHIYGRRTHLKRRPPPPRTN